MPTSATAQGDQNPALMLQGAAQALSERRPAQALTLAQAVLRDHPNTIDALLIQSAAARNLGQFPLAVSSARKAWKTAQSAPAKFAAARLTAQALSASGAKTRAQLWLRRAGQVAPTAELKELARREFRLVRQQNPWAVYLSFGVSPNSNINDGSREDVLVINGLPLQLSPTAKALSGVEYRAGINLRYRLEESKTRRRDLNFRINAETYTLSEEARKDAPEASGSDFATSSVVLSFTQRHRAPNGNGEVTLSADLGFVWYGGEPLERYLRLFGARSIRLSPASKATFHFGTTFNAGSDQADPSRYYTTGAKYQRRVGRGDTLSLSLGLNRLDSENEISDYSAVQTRAAYQFGRPVLGTALSLSLTLESRNYPVSGFTTDGRQDFSATGRANIVFQNIDYYGFAPMVSLSARSTSSNVSRYNSDALGFEVGIRSTF